MKASSCSKGDVVLRFDPRQFQIALDGAKANLAQVGLSMEAMKQDYQRMLRDIDAKQAQVQLDAAQFERRSKLVGRGDVSRPDYDTARFQLLASTRNLESLRMLAQVQLAKLGGSPDIDVKQTPEYLQAQAQVDEAQRQLDHADALRALRRRRHDGRQRAARHVPHRRHGGVRHRVHRARLGRGQSEGNRSHLRQARRSGRGHRRHLSRPHLERHRGEHRARQRRRILGAAGAELLAATGSRSCSAFRCASASSASPTTRRCAPA